MPISHQADKYMYSNRQSAQHGASLIKIFLAGFALMASGTTATYFLSTKIISGPLASAPLPGASEKSLKVEPNAMIHPSETSEAIKQPDAQATIKQPDTQTTIKQPATTVAVKPKTKTTVKPPLPTTNHNDLDIEQMAKQSEEFLSAPTQKSNKPLRKMPRMKKKRLGSQLYPADTEDVDISTVKPLPANFYSRVYNGIDSLRVPSYMPNTIIKIHQLEESKLKNMLSDFLKLNTPMPIKLLFDISKLSPKQLMIIAVKRINTCKTIGIKVNHAP